MTPTMRGQMPNPPLAGACSPAAHAAQAEARQHGFGIAADEIKAIGDMAQHEHGDRGPQHPALLPVRQFKTNSAATPESLLLIAAGR